MKNFTTIRLRLWIPILVFGALSLLLLFLTLQEYRQDELNLEESALTSLRELLARTGPRIENLLRNDMSRLVEVDIADLSVPTEVRSVVLVDNQGLILDGSQMDWRGRPVHEVLPLFDRNHFLSTQETRRPDIHLSSDRNTIIAYQPVVLAVGSGEIRPTRVGMIFVDYDLSRRKATIFHTLIVNSTSVWVVGILLMLALWIALDHWLTQPLFHLKEIVNRFRNGDYLVRADITGQGELTELSEAFNAMADEVLRNITEQKKSEEVLRENEEFLNSVVENIPNMIFVKDARELKFVRFNKAGEELLGYQREDLYGKNDYDFFPHEQAELFTKKDRVVLNSKKLDDIPEETIDTRHQGKRILHTKKIPIVDAQGDPKYLLGISEDITKSKQAEEKLKAQQEFLQNALDALTHPFYVIDANDYTIIVSNKASHFGEYREGTKFFQLTHDRKEPCTGEDHPCSLLEVKRTKKPVVVEHIHTDQAGKKINVEIHAYPIFDSNGELSQVIEYCLDISERKRGEEERRRLVTAIEQGIDSVIITDKNGMIQYVNPSFGKITGYTKDEVIGKNPRILQSGKHDALFYQEMWRKLASGKAWRGHLINKKKDGTLFEEEVSITPVLNEAGEIINQVAVKRDVTGQMQLEEQLRQAQKMEAIGTLAGGIAHDFNNILAPILGYSELALARISPGDPLAADLQQVITAAGRAKGLVQQILAFSRQAPQERKPFQPHLVVKEALKLLRASLPSTIEIRAEIPAECGAILADPTQFHQIIMNLCTNAYHAMRETGGVLGVRMAKITINENDSRVPSAEIAPGDYVLIEVSDTGCGMEQKTLAHIFDPYFTTKSMGEGTGLGLSVVHGIVKSYQGQITVYSEPGKGTRFHVYLPRIAETPSLAEADRSGAIPTGTERVLVVDDEAVITTMLEVILQGLGYQVTSSGNSLEALALIDQDPMAFDLLITDMTMPHLTGFELAHKAMAIRADLPIILCTGFSELINKEQAQALGIRAYLTKPVSMLELGQTVRKVLDAKRELS
jgi:PAS domain S-box-containing protein